MLDAIGLASSHNWCERASRMRRTASREKRSQHVGTEYSIFQRAQPERSSIDPSMAFWTSDVSVYLVRSLALDMDGVSLSQHFPQLMVKSVDTVECTQWS